jgi:hypothetical protein
VLQKMTDRVWYYQGATYGFLFVQRSETKTGRCLKSLLVSQKRLISAGDNYVPHHKKQNPKDPPSLGGGACSQRDAAPQDVLRGGTAGFVGK